MKLSITMMFVLMFTIAMISIVSAQELQSNETNTTTSTTIVTVGDFTDENEIVSCVDLSLYVKSDKDRENLNQFLSGGDIISNKPVFFDIPRLTFSNRNFPFTLCLHNVLIPDSINGNICRKEPTVNNTGLWGNCFLAIGQRGYDDDNTDTCSTDYDDDDPLRSCYRCACGGTNFGIGEPFETQVDACGFGSKDWGMICPDIQNGRELYTLQPSNVSSIHISVCPSRHSLCNDVCRLSGTQSPFEVGLQWITNIETECFDKPFQSVGVSTFDHWSLLLTNIVGITIIIGLLIA